uniref:Putative secreted protein n=1 Tax=Ixodes ricinus TaxID=34613 RepID=A0A6B0U2C9_IXORI
MFKLKLFILVVLAGLCFVRMASKTSCALPRKPIPNTVETNTGNSGVKWETEVESDPGGMEWTTRHFPRK